MNLTVIHSQEVEVTLSEWQQRQITLKTLAELNSPSCSIALQRAIATVKEEIMKSHEYH